MRKGGMEKEGKEDEGKEDGERRQLQGRWGRKTVSNEERRNGRGRKVYGRKYCF